MTEKRQSKTCASCPGVGIPGDARCKFTRDSSLNDLRTGCPTCGCQLCPDNNYYFNNVADYCSATPSNTCGVTPYCRVLFSTDPRCTILEPNPETVPSYFCEAKCQKCPDGKIYGDTSRYQQVQPLSSDEVKDCLHVKYPFPPAQDQCS